jgi:hypothetical protein
MPCDPVRSDRGSERPGPALDARRRPPRPARPTADAARRTVRAALQILVVVCPALPAAPAQAGQDWELISVTRGATWEVNQAKGPLKQTGTVLEGTLKDRTDGKADYRIRIELDGERAKGRFRFLSESDNGTTLTGVYKRAANPTRTHCPEQIQLMNSFQYIGLVRNACEP